MSTSPSRPPRSACAASASSSFSRGIAPCASMISPSGSPARERAQLARVVDLALVPGFLAVEALYEFGALGHLALEDPPVVALVADDVGREEEEKIGLGLLGGLVAEEPPDHRQRAEHRQLL